jgi:hypothetical protein
MSDEQPSMQQFVTWRETKGVVPLTRPTESRTQQPREMPPTRAARLTTANCPARRANVFVLTLGSPSSPQSLALRVLAMA